MGYHVAWVAVRGKPSEAVRSQLNLRSAGVAAQRGDPWPDAREYGGSIIAATLKSGWYLLLADADDRKPFWSRLLGWSDT